MINFSVSYKLIGGLYKLISQDLNLAFLRREINKAKC